MKCQGDLWHDHQRLCYPICAIFCIVDAQDCTDWKEDAKKKQQKHNASFQFSLQTKHALHFVIYDQRCTTFDQQSFYIEDAQLGQKGMFHKISLIKLIKFVNLKYTVVTLLVVNPAFQFESRLLHSTPLTFVHS